MSTMPDLVHYGIISTAQIARTGHIPACKEVASAEITAIASRRQDRAEEVAQELGIPKAYGSYDELPPNASRPLCGEIV